MIEPTLYTLIGFQGGSAPAGWTALVLSLLTAWFTLFRHGYPPKFVSQHFSL